MNNRCLILLFVVALAGLTSCKDNDDVFKTVQYADIDVINASSSTLNFYLNGTRQNNSSSLVTGGSSGYLSVPSGTANYQFKTAGTFDLLFSVPLTLTYDTNTSLYVAGTTTDMTFYTTDVLSVDTAASTSTVRFVDAAPDAGNLTASITSTSATVNFTDRAFKSSSAFTVVTSGDNVIKVYQEGSTTALIDTTITLQTTSIYTLYTKGLLKGTGTSRFSLGIITNY